MTDSIDDNSQSDLPERKCFQCIFCAKFSNSLDSLKEHMAVHLATFYCFCNKPYKSARGLKRHMSRVHATFACVFCPMKYRHKQSLQSHLLSAHSCTPVHHKQSADQGANQEAVQVLFNKESQPIFNCVTCTKQFTNVGSLRKHTSLVHATQHDQDTPKRAARLCPNCHKEFANKKYLNRHLNRNSCKLVAAAPRSSQLLGHQAAPIKDELDCEIINKLTAIPSDSLKDHLRANYERHLRTMRRSRLASYGGDTYWQTEQPASATDSNSDQDSIAGSCQRSDDEIRFQFRLSAIWPKVALANHLNHLKPTN